MPTVLRIQGYRFGFFSADADEPPHVHVDKAGNSAKFWINPIHLANDVGFARHELREIHDLVAEHQQQLLRAWHEKFR